MVRRGLTISVVLAAALSIWLGLSHELSAAEATNPHGVAVIIGNKAYRGDIPTAAYAHNDAGAFKRYVIEGMGFDPANIIDLRDASKADIEAAFGNANEHRGLLWRRLDPQGRSDIVIYYSGHGVPGQRDRRGYLLPSNANPNVVEINGFPIDLLIANLNKLEVRSALLVLEACFSGGSHGGSLIGQASPGYLAAKPIQPGSVTVLTAAQGNQLASWDEDAKHGLFTRHLLDALKGAADFNGDRAVRLDEVRSFLTTKMTVAARLRYGREQQAELLGTDDLMLVHRLSRKVQVRG